MPKEAMQATRQLSIDKRKSKNMVNRTINQRKKGMGGTIK